MIKIRIKSGYPDKIRISGFGVKKVAENLDLPKWNGYANTNRERASQRYYLLLNCYSTGRIVSNISAKFRCWRAVYRTHRLDLLLCIAIIYCWLSVFIILCLKWMCVLYQKSMTNDKYYVTLILIFTRWRHHRLLYSTTDGMRKLGASWYDGRCLSVSQIVPRAVYPNG